ncbi:MAG: hypothetical protein VYA80_04620 [Pseudomonadota bacterium]|nr:hypothetical protein [Pseudomonadota bacterium]
MNTTQLNFNIIFTPNTVKRLLPFVYSLLDWSDCQYQIVCNGCSKEEQQLLRNFCLKNSRLTYIAASENEITEHGLVLDWLQSQTESEWFCFLDSDIIATGPYLSEAMGHLNQYDVFTSGHPLWYAEEDIELPPSFKRWLGSCFKTTDGKTLGGTYFAIYNNKKLGQVISETGVGFRFQRWDEVTKENQDILESFGLNKFDYDTGKLLMALMFAKGINFYSKDLEHIHHLGGFSSLGTDEPAVYYRGWLDKFACLFLSGHLAWVLLKIADTWYGLTRPAKGMTSSQSKHLSISERRILQSRERKRLNTARYFAKVIQNLVDNQPLPVIPVMGFKKAEDRILEATSHISKLYKNLT